MDTQFMDPSFTWISFASKSSLLFWEIARWKTNTLHGCHPQTESRSDGVHISDILGFLGQSFKVDIVLDAQVVMPEPKAGEDEIPRSSAFVTDGMIGYINAKDIPMAEALYTLTRLINLTYRVDKDGIYISTPDRVKGKF